MIFPWKQLQRLRPCSHHGSQFTMLSIVMVMFLLIVYQNTVGDRGLVVNPALEELALQEMPESRLRGGESSMEGDPYEEVDVPQVYRREGASTQRSINQPRGTSRPPRPAIVHLKDEHSTWPTTPIPKLVARIDDLSRPPYLFMLNLGRFGNHLFQFASLYGIAKATNRTPVLYPTARESLDQYFKGVTVLMMTQPEKVQVEQILEDSAGKVQPSFFHLNDNDLELCCFLQSWKYFQRYESELRRQLVFHDHIVNDTRAELQELVDRHVQRLGNTGNRTVSYQSNATSPENFTIIGVHIRRQDVADPKQMERGYKPAPASYFHRAMNFYRERHQNPLFIVLGDELIWAQKHLSHSPQGALYTDIEFRTGMRSTDFPLLATCDHVVISVGTYGWWGAWLSGGTVVYYSDWPTPGTEIGDQYVAEDYFPPHWVGLGE